MKIKAVNHICVVVRDKQAAENFYVGVLGLNRHHKIESWFVVTKETTLHLVEIPEAEATESLYHEIQHFALQVEDLPAAYDTLLDADLKPFQMDFQGTEKALSARNDPLSFGLGSVFVRDPDGNLVEFLEEGRGIFTADMRPQV